MACLSLVRPGVPVVLPWCQVREALRQAGVPPCRKGSQATCHIVWAVSDTPSLRRHPPCHQQVSALRHAPLPALTACPHLGPATVQSTCVPQGALPCTGSRAGGPMPLSRCFVGLSLCAMAPCTSPCVLVGPLSLSLCFCGPPGAPSS